MMDAARAGLTASQFGLELVSRNIANANTAGYSRQEVQFESTPGGVRTWTVRSQVDNFIDKRISQESQNQGRLDVERRLMGEVTPLLGSTETGIDASLTAFFASVSAVAASPDGVEERAQMMFQADALVRDFNATTSELTRMTTQIDQEIGATIKQANQLAGDIANLNKAISSVPKGTGADGMLIDQRREVAKELAQLINLNAFEDANGSLNIFGAGGVPLVEGVNSFDLTLSSATGFSGHPGVAVIGPSGEKIDITSRLNNGELGGMLRIRDDVIGTALADIDRVAASLSLNFNRIHAQGYGLDGSTGNDFFSTITPSAVGAAENVGRPNISVSVIDNSAVTLDDYVVEFTSPTQFNLTNTTQGTTVATGLNFTNGATVDVDGLRLTFTTGSSAPVGGERFEISSSRNHGLNISKTLTNQDQIATALKVGADSAANGGQGTISATVVDSAAVTFDQYRIRFTAPGTFDVLNVTQGTTLSSGNAYTTGMNLTVGGIQVTLADGAAGAPQAGENYDFNGRPLPSANGNALALSKLETDKLLDGGTLALGDKFARIGSQVGMEQQAVETAADAQGMVMESLTLSRASVSGVSLDEEAARLIQFQNTYQASARLIRVADEMLQSIINMV